MEDKYPKSKKAVEYTMKVIQRELEDDMLKVNLLEGLVQMREKLNGKRTAASSA